MQNNFAETDVVTERRGAAGIIRLNRPKAINSLTLVMVHEMRASLERFEADTDVKCVVLLGEGERGLCAGGDVRQIYSARHASEEERTRFWRDEFPLNYLISHYSKPFVALMDGIVMGGGVGISAHGSHRIVTERTRLAMPETAIGYFPDVGATWLLPKAPGEAGTWLGLTGKEIGAADALYARLADYHVPSQELSKLIDGLSEVSSEDGVDQVIRHFATAPDEGVLQRNQALIDEAFRFDQVEDIISELEKRDDDFAPESLALLNMRSPTSMKLTLLMLRKGRDSSGLVECLEREFVAGCEILRRHDFYEGVRAALVDKDRNPQWKPSSLSDVTECNIASYLKPSAAPLFPDHRL